MKARSLLLALFVALFAAPSFSQDMIIITPSGVLTNPTTIPPRPYLAITEDGVGVNTTTPGSDFNQAKGKTAFEVKSIDDGFALLVNQDNPGANDMNSYGIYVDSESQFDPGGYFDTWGGSAITQLAHPTSNIGTNWFYRDVPADVSNVPLMRVQQDNSGDDQTLIQLQQDGSGDYIASDSKFLVAKSGAVVSYDTFYFRYAAAGGKPLCYSASGKYNSPQHYFLRPCSGVASVNTDRLCIGNTCVTETILKALLTGKPEFVTAVATD